MGEHRASGQDAPQVTARIDLSVGTPPLEPEPESEESDDE